MYGTWCTKRHTISSHAPIMRSVFYPSSNPMMMMTTLSIYIFNSVIYCGLMDTIILSFNGAPFCDSRYFGRFRDKRRQNDLALGGDDARAVINWTLTPNRMWRPGRMVVVIVNLLVVFLFKAVMEGCRLSLIWKSIKQSVEIVWTPAHIVYYLYFDLW